MAEEKTKLYNIRLAKGFVHELGHRRAGIHLHAGPTPETHELTADQVGLLKNDPMIEFVSDKDLKKATATTEPTETAEEIAAREADEAAAKAQEEADAKAKADAEAEAKAKAKAAAGTTGNEPVTGDPAGNPSGRNYEGNEGQGTDLSTLSLAELQAKATELNVVDADKIRSKQAAIEAIENASKPSGE